MAESIFTDEELKAIKLIQQITKNAIGKDLTDAEAQELFTKTKEKMLDSMAQTRVET